MKFIIKQNKKQIGLMVTKKLNFVYLYNHKSHSNSIQMLKLEKIKKQN